MKIYVEISAIVHSLSICAHTLCMSCVTETFALVMSSIQRKQLLCFVYGQGQKHEQKPTTKKFVGFHNHSRLLTMQKANIIFILRLPFFEPRLVDHKFIES